MAGETSNSDRDVGVQATQEGLTQIKNEADAKVEELQNQLRVITETDHDNGKLNITLDAKAGLSDLAKNFDPLQGGVSELNDPQQVTKGIRVVDTPVSATTSEKIPMEKTDAKNTMTHGNRLKEASYRKQVQNVLNTETADPKKLTKIIKELQKKLEVKADGALGPNTFDKLKVEWDKSQEGNPKQTYKEFINALMGRTVDAQKPPETKLNNVHISIPDQTLTAIGPDFEEQKKN